MAYRSLFEFKNEADVLPFRSIDDRVMGGVSSSALVANNDKTATFSGIVSLENNGGFASVRAPLPCSDLSMGTGLALRARGDGKRYKLRLTNTASFDSIVYEASFSTLSGDWKEIEFPFSSFKPRWRGRPVSDAAEFDAAKVFSLGLMIAEKQVGPFWLQLDWIRLYG